MSFGGLFDDIRFKMGPGGQQQGGSGSQQSGQSMLAWFLVLVFVIIVVVALCCCCSDEGPKVGGFEEDFVDFTTLGGGYDEYDDDSVLGGGLYGGDEETKYDGVVGGTHGMPRIGIREPWFKKMYENEKLVEARLCRGAAASLKAGDAITIARSRPPGDTKEHDGPRRFETTVEKVSKFAKLKDLVEKVGVEKLFGKDTKLSVNEGLKAYEEFYKKEDEDAHGWVAIYLHPHKDGAHKAQKNHQ